MEGGGGVAGEGGELDVGGAGDGAAGGVADGEAGLLEGAAHGAEGRVRSVVLLGEVAEEDVGEGAVAAARLGVFLGEEGGEVGGGVVVAHVAGAACDARFQVFGIDGVGLEHAQVVVGLYHGAGGQAQVMVGAVGDEAGVGGDDKMVGAAVNGEAHVVGAVVAGLEGGYGEAAGLEGYLFVDGLVVVFDAAADGVAAQESGEGAGRAEELEVAVGAQEGVGKAHVVAVVVGEDDAGDGGDVDAVLVELFGDGFGVDAGVDEQAAAACADVGAVARAARAE